MSRKSKKQVIKFRDILFLKILIEAYTTNRVLTRSEAVTVFNESVKRLGIPLSKTAPIRGNSAVNEIVAHLRQHNLIAPKNRLEVIPENCVEFWKKLQYRYTDWQSWPVEISL